MDLSIIQEAHRRIEKHIVRTPLRRWNNLERRLKLTQPLFLKLETFQSTGSFKIRGAANKVLELIEKGQTPKHVLAASAGNHAQGVAAICGALKIPATIVMPEGAPLVKSQATQDYGAEVVLHGAIYDEAYAKAQEILKQKPGGVYVHAYEDLAIIAGQGTVGLEIHDQLLEAGIAADQPIQIVVPVGGGGLISGVATALKKLRPHSKIFGIVGETAPAMALSFQKGVLQDPPRTRSRTLAEGLAVKKVSQLTFNFIKELVDEFAIVSDDDIAVAIAFLMERGKLVVEGSGAAGVAALLAHRLPSFKSDLPTVVVLCGGNIDLNVISNILERGLVLRGRWANILVEVEDKPGQLALVAQRLGELQANVLEVHHDRHSSRCPVGKTRINFKLETKGRDHVQQVAKTLEQEGFIVEVGAP